MPAFLNSSYSTLLGTLVPTFFPISQSESRSKRGRTGDSMGLVWVPKVKGTLLLCHTYYGRNENRRDGAKKYATTVYTVGKSNWLIIIQVNTHCPTFLFVVLHRRIEKGRGP